MKDELKGEIAAVMREQNGRRGETEKGPPFCAKTARPMSVESITSVPDGSGPTTFSLALGPLRRLPNSSALTGVIKLGDEEPITLYRS